MNIKTATDEFAVRYYRWALEDFRREIQDGLPFLRMIQGRFILRVLAFMESLQPEQSVTLSAALVKRFHPRAVDVMGIRLTAEEKEMRRKYDSSWRFPVPREQEIDKQVQAGALCLKVSKKKLAALLREELRSVFEDDPERWGPGWRYSTPVGDWIVHTYVDLGEKRHQLCYDHTITPPDYHARLNEATEDDRSSLLYWRSYRMSLLSWLGISSQTEWDLLTESDIPETAETLSLLCSHFMQAVPDLLEGLVLD